MAYFEPVMSQFSGVCNPTKYKIATATAVERGEVVNLSNGLVIAVADQD